MVDGLQNLIAARAIIAKEENWCISDRCLRTPRGLAFCALGALEAANGAWYPNGGHRYSLNLEREAPAIKLLASMIEEPHYGPSLECAASNVAMYNNCHDHAEVLAWFDRTIAKYDGSERRQKVIDEMINITANVPVKELELV